MKLFIRRPVQEVAQPAETRDRQRDWQAPPANGIANRLRRDALISSLPRIVVPNLDVAEDAR